MILSTYIDKLRCPNGHAYNLRRRATSAGKVIRSRCPICHKVFDQVASPLPKDAAAGPTLERHIEARLVKRVAELGGEVRKVQWIGRRGAPDRLVMLPHRPNLETPWVFGMQSNQTIWVELKAPGGAAKFPKNAHEKAQHREHERMRAMGQRVEVVDSYERIEEILK